MKSAGKGVAMGAEAGTWASAIRSSSSMSWGASHGAGACGSLSVSSFWYVEVLEGSPHVAGSGRVVTDFG